MFLRLRLSAVSLPLVFAVAAALVVAAPVSAEAATPEARDEMSFLRLINQERAQNGLSSLSTNLQLTRIARDWSDQMAAAGRLSHRPRLGSAVDGDWRRLGENVGVGSSVSSLHSAFMNSSGHRGNVLGQYNQVGIGVVHRDGRLWVTVNFVHGSGDWPAFTDVSGGVHRPNVEAIFQRGTTNGCDHKRFCPSAPVTRAQMASFLARELGLPDGSVRGFKDVSSSHPHAGAIGALASRGITSGCSRDRFCPNDPVTRGQMATFLQRALGLASSNPTGFRDVGSTHTHRGAIGALQKAGVTEGCAPDRYCPNSAVRRDQMATFIERAFG